MTKPVITKRATKGSALTYEELDANFQNLDDATLTVNGDTGSIVNSLNGSMTIAGGTALTSSVSGTTLTLNLDNTAVTAGSYTSANITVDAQGRITAASNGSGGVSTGIVNRLSYYDTTTSVNDSTIAFSYDSGTLTDTIQGTSANYFLLKSKNGLSYVAIRDVSSGVNESGISLVATNGYVALGGPEGVTLSGTQATATRFKTIASPGTADIDVTNSAASYANGATVNFSNFSGMVMINRQDGLSGNVALWLCGGGVANKLGDSQANACGVIAGNGAINGYTWTNNTGGTIIVAFASIRGRTSG